MSQQDYQSTETYITVVHEHFLPVALIALLIVLIVIIPYWKIFGKAGFPSALSILMVVPLINLILLYVVAFSQWRVIPARTENQ
ncbi:MAG TPA: hypothetical protein VIX42_09320 [Edaphobacter sp.]